MPNGKGYTVEYNGTSSDDLPEFICQTVKRQLVGTSRHTLAEVAGLEGAWVFPEQPGMRQIVIETAIVADSWPLGRRQALKDLANWLDSRVMAKLEISDEPGVFNWAMLSEAPDIEEWRETGLLDLTFIALPYTFNNDVSEQTYTAVAADSVIDIAVDGDVYTWPVIVISATADLEGLSLTLNGSTLVYEGDILTGTILTFNCISKVVTLGDTLDTDLVGVFDANDLDMSTVSGSFPYLLAGDNELEIDTNIVGYTVDIYWRSRYR